VTVLKLNNLKSCGLNRLNDCFCVCGEKLGKQQCGARAFCSKCNDMFICKNSPDNPKLIPESDKKKQELCRKESLKVK